MACRAAVVCSFDAASDHLEELAAIRIDNETIRRACHRAAQGVLRQRQANPPRAAFAEALGEVEFLTDGVMVPTREGWREMKMADYLKRLLGDPAEPAEWADRALPAPSIQVAYATMADCETFSAQWRPLAVGLGIDPLGAMTGLADGAPWIWNAITTAFPAATQVLDIFHAVEHLASAATALFGASSLAGQQWTEQGRQALLADGWPGLLDHVGATPTQGRTTAGQTGLDEMIAYFAKHTGRLGYYGRLRSGRSIGSGGVESLARRLGRRLKVAGRGWCVGHLEGMAAMIITIDTPEWDGFWYKQAA